MCGIAGYLGPDRMDIKELANSLDKSLSHRGPDNGGYQVIKNKVGSDRMLLFVHRRLSILDLSPLGHQPMQDPEKKNWIVFNGEIYNFKALKESLRRNRVSFTSQSDTEVLLKGYGCKGIKILDDLRGMFAFALWDVSKSELILAVDPIGIKPLYYWIGIQGEFLFASEMKALLNTGLVERQIDPIGLEGYLRFGAVQGPATINKNIRLLPPGSYLRVHYSGKVEGPYEYWNFPDRNVKVTTNEEMSNIVTELRELIDNVVDEHLVSDVPVGIFLSGGIDSSSILASASRHSKNLQTFSVTFKEQEFSEEIYSREMARLYGSKHSEICLSEKELLNALPAFLDALDQPTIDGINVFVISGVVRNAGVKVVLSGQGGDEVFGGYSTFRQVDAATRLRRRTTFFPKMAWQSIGKIWSLIQSRRRVLPDKLGQYFSSNGNPYSTFFLLRQLFPPAECRSLFPGNHGADQEGLPPGVLENLIRKGKELDTISLVSLLETRTYLGNMLLRDGDVMSMAHGLEVRVPFLDRRIVEKVVRLPGFMKMDRKLIKPLLLKIMGERLPSMIYRRPKQGFTFPWQSWLKNELRPFAENALGDKSTFSYLGMEPKEIQRLWKSFLLNRPGISWSRIWSLILLREWAVRNKGAV